MMILVRNLNGLLELLLLLIMSISFNDLIGKRGRKKKEDIPYRLLGKEEMNTRTQQANATLE